MKTNKLEQAARELRIATLKSIYEAKTGHIGSSFSIIELLVYIYQYEIKLTSINVNSINRNQFILSKGHGVPPLYEILKVNKVISQDEKLRQIGSVMQGHPDARKCPAIDASTGSLGQGLAIGVGTALAQQLRNQDLKTIVIVGDGELQEGICFEALSFAATQKLSNLVVIIDNNLLQLTGATTANAAVDWFYLLQTMNANVQVINGHDFNQINNSFNQLACDKLNVIIANTMKGYGVSFMQGNYKWHGTPPNQQEYEKALAELGGYDEKSD